MGSECGGASQETRDHQAFHGEGPAGKFGLRQASSAIR